MNFVSQMGTQTKGACFMPAKSDVMIMPGHSTTAIRGYAGH